MAHFAELDSNSIVIRVIVVHNNECLDANGQENEYVGIGFCTKLFGGIWKQTSYNSNFRKNYAGIGYTYDLARDAFIPPKPYPSWLFVEESCSWLPPISYPSSDDKVYTWDESEVNWIEVI